LHADERDEDEICRCRHPEHSLMTFSHGDASLVSLCFYLIDTSAPAA